MHFIICSAKNKKLDEKCFSNYGLYIDIYGYGMLSMGFDCCLEEILFQSFEGTELD
jgi:uncharacterized membrane protein